MKSDDFTGTVRDNLAIVNGIAVARVNVGDVNLGSLDWIYGGSNDHFQASVTGMPTSGTMIRGIMCSKYAIAKQVVIDASSDDKSIKRDSGKVYIRDTAYSSSTGAQFKVEMSGVMLNYQLATPLTYTNLVYRDNGTDTPLVLPFNYRVDDYGSEEQIMPTPVNDEITSCAAYLDLEYDIVSGIDFIKDTDDKLGDLDYRASRVEDRLDVVDSEIDDLKIPIYSHIPTGGMLPNFVYDLGTLSSNTTFTLATPTDNTILNHWYWTFDIGSTVPTLTWPTGIVWAGDNLSPIIEANKHYEVSVINNIGTYIYSVVI